MLQNCPAQVGITPPQVIWRHLVLPSYFSIAWKWITEAFTLACRTEVIISFLGGEGRRGYKKRLVRNNPECILSIAYFRSIERETRVSREGY